MAELTTESAETTSSCCSPAAQDTCCEPSDKAACCGTAAGEKCGCGSIDETHRVHEHASSAIVRAREPQG